MSATSAPTPRRCALTITMVFLLAVAGFGAWPKIRPPRAAAWTAIESTGTVGTATLTDTAASPGGSCRIIRSIAPGFVDIIANGPVITPAAGLNSQPVGWRAVLLQIMPDGSEEVLATHTRTSLTATTSRPASFSAQEFLSQPLGPRYVINAEIIWFDPATANLVTGRSSFRINFYLPLNEQSTPLGQASNSCRSPEPPVALIPTPRGTVNARAGYSLANFPLNTTLAITWDGKQIGTTTSGYDGSLRSTLIIPATTVGIHTVAWSAGTWTASATYEVVPRIKVIPNTVSRGQTVDISLRGFAKKETVRIRWKRGGSWILQATVLTSNTGSANVFITVPAWAADGGHSVRGDGPTGRAQTNAVTVQGGTFSPAEEATTATATPAPTATPTPTVTPPSDASPVAPPIDTPTGEATATPEPASPTATPEPPPTSTPTTEPTPTATPAEPTATETPSLS